MNNRVKKYLLHLQYERGLSSNTINSYSLDLNKYVSYLKDKFSISVNSDFDYKSTSLIQNPFPYKMNK